jgi:ferric-dicitrate binding protein FerR (iron transport regulator)
MKAKIPNQLNKLLLKKYLNNTCSDQELEQVRQFLQQPESADLFREVFDEAWQEMEEPELDLHAMATYRQQLMQKLQSNNNNENVPETTKLWPTRWMKYAAILILPVMFGIYQFSKNKKEIPVKIAFIESYNPKGQRSTITLSDGTVIYLGSNSKIRYPKTFSNIREMELIGEAFFKVKRDPSRPFIIHTNNIQTKVLGTSFKIEAFKGDPVEVSVATGKVRVDRQVDPTKKQLTSLAVLTPGNLVNWNEKTKKPTLAKVSTEELELWKDGVLTFNNQRLADVMAVLERRYNVNIRISSNKLSNYRINTTCSLDEPITKIIGVMGKAGGFGYKLENDQIIISN